MRKRHFLILLITHLGFAQAPAIEWQKSLGGSAADGASSIQQTSDGGYIVAGTTSSINGNVTGNKGGYDYWVVKMTANGTLQWQKTLGGTQDDYALCVQQTTDGGYIVAGYTNSTNGDVTGNHGDNDYWIVKLAATGDIVWQETLGGTANDKAYSIIQTTDLGYIVIGSTTSNNGDVTGYHGGTDLWIVKLSSSGLIQWQKTLGGTNADFTFGSESIQQTKDGGYIVAGASASNNGDVTGVQGGSDYWIVKLTFTGVIEWQKTMGGTSSEAAYSIYQTAEGGYIVAGTTPSNDGDVTGYHGGSGYDAWIVKLSSIGNIQWGKAIGGTDYDFIKSIKQTTDGSYIAAGFTPSNDGDVSGNHGGYDLWIVKLSDIGNILWQKTLGGSTSDMGSSIQQTSDEGYIAAGSSSFPNGDVTENQGSSDFWIIKLVPETLNTSDFSKNRLQVYPNPTSSILSFQNPQNITIDKILITDLAGKTILQQEQFTPQINVEQLARGMYILQAFSREERFVHRIVKE